MADPKRQRTLDATNPGPLETWLQVALDAPSLKLVDAELLGGGAVQENWRLDIVIDDGPRQGNHRWVLRTDAAVRLSISLDRVAESVAVKLAYDAGVKVPEPIAQCEDTSVIGAAFVVQAFVAGEATAIKLVRDPHVDRWGADVAAELGAQLARIHSIRASQVSTGPLPVVAGQAGKAEVAKLRSTLARAGEARPALEYVLAWLDRNAPPAPVEPVLVHGDFRTGNYLVADGKLAAILDWEFAHFGDPNLDLGWLCAACWRFGRNDRPVGGIAERDALYDVYQAHSGRKIDPKAVHYWEIMAAARWGGIAVLQGDRYRLGGEDSIELALTGLMASELELEALDGLKAYEAQWM